MTLSGDGQARFGSNVCGNGIVILGVRETFSNISRIYAGDGTTLKQISQTSNGRTQASGTPADGDKLQMFFMAHGSETELETSTRKASICAIWDLYINDVLDSSGYDDYAGAGADTHREITLTQKIRPGLNKIELRVNGKNASSTSYTVQVYGASIQ